jgi:release factor glutamine methyltransferase
VGVDISRESLELADFNSKHNDIDNRLLLCQGDILDHDFLRTLGCFDCVVSNPPYVASSERENLQPEITLFEPDIALFCDPDPQIFYKTTMCNISYILRDGGLLAFEVGMGQAQSVADSMRTQFMDIEVVRDLTGIERVVTGIYAGTDKE